MSEPVGRHPMMPPLGSGEVRSSLFETENLNIGWMIFAIRKPARRHQGMPPYELRR